MHLPDRRASLQSRDPLRSHPFRLALVFLAAGLVSSLSGVIFAVDFASPSARNGAGMAYDSARGRVVLFGGNGSDGLLADTWEWDGSLWLRRTTAVSPPARNRPGMAYDSVRERVVLFGGTGRAGTLGDTWEWDGTQWQEASPAVSPVPRYGLGMAFDATRSRTVIFGGTSSTGSTGDTWEWDGTDWVERTPSVSPAPRFWHAMAFDSVRGRTVLFGGAGPGGAFGDTWEWDGSQWLQRSPAHAPSPRYLDQMAYDSVRGRTVLFGGGGYLNDTWEWDGTDWLVRGAATSPPPRGSAGMAYDSARNRTVLFGGQDYNQVFLSDTWEWDGNAWKKITLDLGDYHCDSFTSIGIPATALNVEVKSGCVLNMSAPLTVTGSMVIRSGGVVTHLDRFLDGLQISVSGTMEVEQGGIIDLDARGLKGGDNGSTCGQNGETFYQSYPGYIVGCGAGGSTGTRSGAGGGYGGRGAGGGTFYQSNYSYGVMENPANLGSGGGAGIGGYGGNGGGRATITAPVFHLNGILRANGGDAPPGSAGGGGSGGAILLQTPALDGSGLIEANGGAGGLGGVARAGSGGGGRIAINYNTLNFPRGSIHAAGGVANSAGGAGTIFLKVNADPRGDLIVDNQGAAAEAETLMATNIYQVKSITVRGGGNLNASGAPQSAVVGDILAEGAGSRITQTALLSSGLRLPISGSLVLRDGAQITANGAGLRGGGYPFSPYGNAAECYAQDGATLTSGSAGGAGGSFGGLGGGPGANRTYGLPQAPRQLGSGGSRSTTSGSGGNGGGRIEISAASCDLGAGTSITARGGDAAIGTGSQGGGSGGTVKLDCNALSGEGRVAANGGNGNGIAGNGGGGGRIAVRAGSSTFTGVLEARGGAGTGSGAPGQDGTVFQGDFTAPRVAIMVPAPGSSISVPPAQVVLQFTKDLYQPGIDSLHILLEGVTTGEHTPSSLTFDAPTRTLTISYPAPLPQDSYLLTLLSGEGTSGFCDDSFNALDGDCPAGASSECELGELPSGDGRAGGDFVASFTVRPPPVALGTTPRTHMLFGPAPAFFPAGTEPSAIVTADFDGDGVPDLAAANAGSNDVTVLLGDGAGGFTPQAGIPVGNRPVSIAAADFNHDGHQDLAVANFNDDTVSILLGDGAGEFSRIGDVPVGGNRAFFVVAAEMTGDGEVDLAVADSSLPAGPGHTAVLAGDGAGHFSSAFNLISRTGEAPVALSVADLNDDGTADLAILDLANKSVNVQLQYGPGSFYPAGNYPVADAAHLAGCTPSAILAGDFNADGRVDLVVTDKTNNTADIFQGSGYGSFSPAVGLPTEETPSAVGLGDLDNDGISDLVVANEAGDSLSILLGDRRSNFSGTRLAVAGNPSAVAVGDFNGDGAEDLAVALSGRDGVVVLLGEGSGTFARPSGGPLGLTPASMAVGNLDSGKTPDLAVANRGSDTVSILLGDGSGGLSPHPDVAVGSEPVSVAAADFNGDGFADLAVANSGGNSLSILRGDGTGAFTDTAEVPAGSAPSWVVSGDLDHQAGADLAVASSGSSEVLIFLGDGAGNFTPGGRFPVGRSPVAVVLGDLNGDGAADLAVANRDDGTVTILQGDGAGGFRRTADITVGGGPVALTLGDLNDDGTPDLAVACRDGKRISILLGDGLGGFLQAPFVTLKGAPESLSLADFNKDGLPDLAVVSSETGTAEILQGTGTGAFFSGAVLWVGGNLSSVAAADFNDDGAQDLGISLAPSSGRGSMAILLNRLPQRADLNGSNGVDGFDVGEIGRRAGCRQRDACYRENVDVNENGMIDGDDLALVASRFGERGKSESPLRGELDPNFATTDPGTVTFQRSGSEGDVLSVQIVANQTGEAVAAADFAVTFDPRILGPGGFTPGSYLAGDGALQIYNVDTSVPGRIGVGVVRLKGSLPDGKVGTRAESIVNLLFRAINPGQTTLQFEAFQTGDASLLDASGQEVPAVFRSGATVQVQSASGTPAGQQISVSPGQLQFGDAAVGTSTRKSVRISNIGFQDLRITGAEASPAEFRSFFTSPFTIAPGGMVELSVSFTPTHNGVYSGALVLASDDPLRPTLTLPLVGSTGVSIAATPDWVDFGPVAVGGSTGLPVRIANRGSERLTITGLATSQREFFAFSNYFGALDPGQSGDLQIVFQPTAVGDYSGFLTVSFDAPEVKTVTLRLSGRAAPDSDSDGIIDELDRCPNDPLNDNDGDGRCGDVDNCPNTYNRDQADTDGDGKGNLCDACPFDFLNDADGDRKCGDVDNCPATYNPNQADRDGDFLGDACDACPDDPANDADGDGICGNLDNCPSVANPDQADGDGDAKGDACDPCPLDPLNDQDGDGYCANQDNCPLLYNPGQEDEDHDGLGDVCDPCPGDILNDQDGDGICDSVDPCPGDPLNDFDGDGVCEGKDNCPSLYNPTQQDTDGDGKGDACDVCPLDPANDADHDGYCANLDNCPAVSNPTQADSDGDHLGDACDPCPLDPANDADHDGYCANLDNCPAVPNPTQADSDGDHLGDACDPCPLDPANDADKDGVCGNLDNCPAVANPGQADRDTDGRGDVCDNCPDAYNPGQQDSNGDGAGDACQPVVDITGIQQDGGPELEVTVRLEDPDGDKLHGVVRVLDPKARFTLNDFISSPDCTAALPPESLPGVGIAFTSGPLLFDADSFTMCQDGLQDYELALGTCAAPEGAFDISLDLSGVTPPHAICIRRVDHSADFDFTAETLESDHAVLLGPGYLVSETTYTDTTLPTGISLSSLVPGQTYEIEITTTDGDTPLVSARREFLYQGEGTIRFLP
jgi:VCBS repeat protein/HYDIN/CFA65/VesB family protein/thrombospondin type 3 repeat protein